MTGTESGNEYLVERLGCPVYGDQVTCTATYQTSPGGRTLVDFACNMEGMCGIPSFDPCPMYVAYLEQLRAS